MKTRIRKNEMRTKVINMMHMIESHGRKEFELWLNY